MRHVFILNPAAGKHTDAEAITREIQTVMAPRGEAWRVEVTKAPGHAEALAREACEESSDPVRIYAMGGDGTLNEVVNGAAGYDHAAVGICPLGSGNDFIKTFGPNEVFRDIEGMVTAPEYVLDLIECCGRQSINICSVGFDSRVGLGMVNYKRWPLVTGKGAYLISLVVCIIQGIHRHYDLELDGEPISGEFTLICACNGRWYGGSFNPTAEAMPDDGELDFLIVKACSRLKVAKLVGKYATAHGYELPDLIRIQKGHTLKVKCDRVSMINIDGERVDTDSLSFALSAKKIHFLIPERVGWRKEKA